MARPRKIRDDMSIFAKRIDFLLANENISLFERKYGLAKSTVQRIFEGGEPTRPTLEAIIKGTGCNAAWLVAGIGEPFSPGTRIDQTDNPLPRPPPPPTPFGMLPHGNAIRRKGDQDAAHNVLHLRAIGDAAALEQGTSQRSGFSDTELFWDDVEEIPESTHLVRVRGDSMSPLMLHGQFVMVGPQYRPEIGDVPDHRDIVIASISIQENDIGGIDSEWEGVHCKRIQDGGPTWLFTSINPKGETFSVAKEHCRLWRVIGVYFAGRGKPPEED